MYSDIHSVDIYVIYHTCLTVTWYLNISMGTKELLTARQQKFINSSLLSFFHYKPTGMCGQLALYGYITTSPSNEWMDLLDANETLSYSPFYMLIVYSSTHLLLGRIRGIYAVWYLFM